jgi:hypothetical protein
MMKIKRRHFFKGCFLMIIYKRVVGFDSSGLQESKFIDLRRVLSMVGLELACK